MERIAVAETELNDVQDRIVRRFRRLVRDAHAAGLEVHVDVGDSPCVRFVLRELALTHEADIRGLGEAVRVDNGCGGEVIPRFDTNGNG